MTAKDFSVEEAPMEKAEKEALETAEETSSEKATAKNTPTEEELHEMIEHLSNEAHSLAVELATEKEKYLRLMAEYDNFRKRSQKERENIYSEVRGDTIAKLLPVYDNLERALRQPTEDEAYRKGVDMIMVQLQDIFGKLGVTEILAAPGTPFDPEIHDAVMHVENADMGESVVAEEFQKGFRLGDKVLRFSMVKVAN